MVEIEDQIAEYIRNLISKKGKDILSNPIGMFGAICDAFISYSDILMAIKPAAVTDASVELKRQLEIGRFDCKKIFDEFKTASNQEALNQYLKIVFQAIDCEEKFVYSSIEVLDNSTVIKEKKVKLEKGNEKNKTADDYYELAKAQKTIRGIDNKSIYIGNLLKAVEMGHCEAIHIMAHYYIKGKYVPLDIDKGIKLLKQIADDGNALAAYDLFNLSKRNVISFDEAFPYLKVAANGGMKSAIFDLGMVYYENGSPEDYVNAVKWFEQACEFGDMHSYYQLALCYRFGHGVKCDGKKAMELLKKAAMLGHYKAKEIIGD
ncbi:MAG: sel1 repeat family protein [Lachnospiraceae bacterium]|nr:sel1 repeat family protein [Lachnospiraceae bacterium]